jgi:hypothetical protein
MLLKGRGRLDIQEWYDKLNCHESWLLRGYVARLYECARTSPGPILEIGAWLGRSLAVLALGAKEAEQYVVAVDPWHVWPNAEPPFEAGRAVLPDYPSVCHAMPMCFSLLEEHDLRRYVIPIVHTTELAAPILTQMKWGFIHIDGDHSRASVRYDLSQTAANLLPGGHIIFHDSGYKAWPREKVTHPGVDEGIDDWVREGADGCIEIEPVRAEVPHRVFMRPTTGRPGGLMERLGIHTAR